MEDVNELYDRKKRESIELEVEYDKEWYFDKIYKLIINLLEKLNLLMKI